MENNDQLDILFTALADRKRRQMLEELSEEAQTVGDLAAACGLKQSAASKHIRQLEAAGLIYKTKRGRIVYCHMNFEIWQQVAGYIAMHARFWNNRLDALDKHLKEVLEP